MLSISGLQQFYGASHTLWDVELEVPAGACLSVMGRNGVGKTTLLKAVMGLLPVTAGSIRFDGVDIAGLPAAARAELGIGYVPQGREIFSQLSVEENLRTGLRAAGRHGVRRIPDAVYELFPVLGQMLKRRGGDLSGGQQQQLAIARALVLQPRLLILDEPTEGIQPNIVAEIGEVIVGLNRPQTAAPALAGVLSSLTRDQGVTVLIVEQKLPFARKVADRFCIMDRGRLVAGGMMPALQDDMVKRYLTV